MERCVRTDKTRNQHAVDGSDNNKKAGEIGSTSYITRCRLASVTFFYKNRFVGQPMAVVEKVCRGVLAIKTGVIKL